jgi:UDP-N-acetylglucosamine--N-acetylmuramyl-(pentapeptide) pyrophosphoryl-undecaprenol N-acetylglucosamine transferase
LKKTIFIAGGGTGGHIYPGLALARSLQELDPELEIHFVGTAAGLEKKIIPREGFPLHLISGGKLNFEGAFFEKLKTLAKLSWGLVQSLSLLSKYRPQFVLGVGGYASGPFVLMSSLFGFPSGIWEPNAQPGLANRWLARFVDICFVVFEEAKKILRNEKIVVAGMPVRAEIEAGRQSTESNGKFHLLCFGGSQGSRAINRVLCEALLQRGDWTKDIEVVHQIGATDWKVFQDKYKGTESFVTPMEFIYDMPKYYSWADLVLCRGGASTLSELAAFGVVPIVVPLPAADNHQGKNAEALVKANAAVMIPQSELTVERLVQEIERLKSNPELRKQMAENIKTFYKPNSAETIARQILDLSSI